MTDAEAPAPVPARAPGSSDARGPLEWLAFGAVFVGIPVLLLWLGRSSVFFHDEMWYLCGRSLADVGSWFEPHNEHWVTLHVIAYLAVTGIFGTATHLPVQVLLVASHMAAVAGLFVIVDRRVSRAAGLSAAAVFGVFGAGDANLFWGFESGFNGAIALGLWALAVLPERPRLAAVLLVFGTMTQGSVLPYIPAAAVLLWPRREILWLALPVVAFAGFRLVSGVPTRGSFIPGEAIGYVWRGVTTTFARAAGDGWAVLGLGVIAAIVMRVRPGRLTAAGLVGILSTFGILAVSRQGYAPATLSQYLYTGAPFALMVAADVLGHPTRRAWLAVPFVIVAISANLALTVSNGVEWPGIQADRIEEGANVVPPAICPSPDGASLGRLRSAAARS